LRVSILLIPLSTRAKHQRVYAMKRYEQFADEIATLRADYQQALDQLRRR